MRLGWSRAGQGLVLLWRLVGGWSMHLVHATPPPVLACSTSANMQPHLQQSLVSYSNPVLVSSSSKGPKGARGTKKVGDCCRSGAGF